MFDVYSKLGWFLFPIKPRSKAPATPNGFKAAAITKHSEWGNLNVGLATGASGLVVVDIDLQKGGSLEAIEKHVGTLPPTTRAATGGGGLHLIYKLPVSCVHPPTRLAILPGIDILSATGYIIIAPSIHPNGKAYEWLVSPADLEPQPCPQTLLEFITNYQKKEPDTRPFTKGKEIFLGAGDGRWDKLRKFAGSMRNWGWSAESIQSALEGFAANQCEPDDSISIDKIRDIARFAGGKDIKDFTQKVAVRYPDGSIVKINNTDLMREIINGAVVLREVK